MANQDDELREIQLQTARLTLEEARDRIAVNTAKKAQKARMNAQRQGQLRIDNAGRREVARLCSHRQGATPKNPLKGKGPTALNVIKMPDGFTIMIQCSICRLNLYSPFPGNMSQKVKAGETKDDMKHRVEKFHADKKFFDLMLEKATEGLTEESTQAMDCGVKIRVTDADGMPVYRPRPSDSYALQFS
jgi:hypothetical protein